jgi:hypothetical protein
MFPHISGASSADEEPAPEVSEESSVEEEDEVVDDAAVTDHAPKRKVKRRRVRWCVAHAGLPAHLDCHVVMVAEKAVQSCD